MILFRCFHIFRVCSFNSLVHDKLGHKIKCRLFTCDPVATCRLRFYRPSYCEELSTLHIYRNVHETKLPHAKLILNQTRGFAKGAPQKGVKLVKPKVQLSEEVLNEVINTEALKQQMLSVLDKLKADYVNSLTVRGSGSIETLPVTIEGDVFPLNEIAQIFRKNPQLVVINMSNFQEGQTSVMKALQKSGMNLNPQQDGTMIYVPLAKVTREHRQKLAVSAKAMFNRAKDNLRGIQNTFTRGAKNQSELSEDLIFNTAEYIRFVCDSHVLEAEKLFKTKEKELLGDDGLK